MAGHAGVARAVPGFSAGRHGCCDRCGHHELLEPRCCVAADAAMFGTAGTPPEIVERLNGIVNAALKDPAIADKLLPQEIVPKPMKVAEFKAFVDSERAKFGNRGAGQYQVSIDRNARLPLILANKIKAF